MFKPSKKCEHPYLTDKDITRIQNEAAYIGAENKRFQEQIKQSEIIIADLRKQVKELKIIEGKYRSLMMDREFCLETIAELREEVDYFKSREKETMELLNQLEGLEISNRELDSELYELKENTRNTEAAQKAIQALRQRKRRSEE